MNEMKEKKETTETAETKWNIEMDTRNDNPPVFKEINMSNEPPNLHHPPLVSLLTPPVIEKTNIIIEPDDEGDNEPNDNDNAPSSSPHRPIQEGFDRNSSWNYIKQKWKESADKIDKFNPLMILATGLLNIYGWFVSLFPFTFDEYTLGLVNFAEFVLFIICIYVTYNVFFVFVYKENGKRPAFIEINSVPNLFIFKFIFGPLALMQIVLNFVFEWIDKWFEQMEFTGIIPHKMRYKVLFVLIFMLSAYFSKTYLIPMYRAFINSIRFEKDEWNDVAVAIITIYAIVSTMYVEMTVKPKDLQGMLTEVTSKFSALNIIIKIATLLGLIIFSTINAWIFVFFLCLVIGTVMFLAIPLYKGLGAFAFFEKINDFCQYESVEDVISTMVETNIKIVGGSNMDTNEDDTTCKMPLTAIQQIIKIIMDIIDAIFANIFELAFIALFLFHTYIYITKLVYSQLQISFIAICVGMVSVLAVNAGVKMFGKNKINVIGSLMKYILMALSAFLALLLIYTYLNKAYLFPFKMFVYAVISISAVCVCCIALFNVLNK
jgi:hypothetical protein